jgi:hypothetical protein
MKNKIKRKVEERANPEKEEVGGVYVEIRVPIEGENFETLRKMLQFLYGYPDSFERREGIEKTYSWKLKGREFTLSYSPIAATLSLEYFVPTEYLDECFDGYMDRVLSEFMNDLYRKLTALKCERSKGNL